MSNWNGQDRRKQKKILLIDDEEEILKLYEITANKLGFYIKTVKLPFEFIKEYETGDYDLAFVDFSLNFYDGVDLIRLLHKEKAPHTKLFLLTHYDEKVVKEKLNGDKINGLLSKSETLPKILASICIEGNKNYVA
jgi:CheY-like chemotaxis protein